MQSDWECARGAATDGKCTAFQTNARAHTHTHAVTQSNEIPSCVQHFHADHYGGLARSFSRGFIITQSVSNFNPHVCRQTWLTPSLYLYRFDLLFTGNSASCQVAFESRRKVHRRDSFLYTYRGDGQALGAEGVGYAGLSQSLSRICHDGLCVSKWPGTPSHG